MRSLTYWLGTLDEYKAAEKSVSLAVSLESLSAALFAKFKIDLGYQDPVVRRSKEQFGFEQSYDISESNKDWFTNNFRPEDYKLVDYIKNQPYYYTPVSS